MTADSAFAVCRGLAGLLLEVWLSLLGRDDLEKFTSTLDEDSVLGLVQDLLVVRSHTGIRRMDGPGDGKRDIFSKLPSGQNHLVQCKYHEKASVSCSSSVLDELPMALLKFGYSSGLFVTTGRISPQAKREFMDNYPAFQLEFLDGEALFREILNSPVLRGLWLENGCAVQANYSVQVPIYFRSILGEASITEKWQKERHLDLCQYLSDQTRGALDVTLRHSWLDSHHFEPYAEPVRLTQPEAVLRKVPCWLLVIRGAPLPEISEGTNYIVAGLLGFLQTKDIPAVALVGRPKITPFSGSDVGFDIELPAEVMGLIRQGDCLKNEKRFYELQETDEWTALCDARVSEIDEVRYYCHSEDILVDLNYVSNLSTNEQNLKGFLRQTSEGYWRSSIFVRDTAERIEALEKVIGLADEEMDIFDGKLAAWLHPSLLGNCVTLDADAPGFLRQAPAELHAQGLPKVALSEDWAKRSRTILNACNELGLIPVESGQARHLVAAFGNDPLPEIRHGHYTTADLIANFESLPKPISYKGFSFEFLVAWRSSADLSLSNLEAAISVALPEAMLAVEHFDGAAYLVIRIRALSEAAQTGKIQSLQLRIENAGRSVLNRVTLLESAHQTAGLARSQRATRDYWYRKTNVTLKPDSSTRDKEHSWTIDAQGNVIKSESFTNYESRSDV